MGTDKKQLFSDQSNQVARFAKALSHPARVEILKLLVERRSCICGDIVLELPLSQSTVSQHLKELRLSGLIQGEVEGAKVCYCLNSEVLNLANEIISDFIRIISTERNK